MTLFKNVDGIDIPLNEDEITDFNLRQAEFDASKSARDVAEFTSLLIAYLDTKASERQYSSAISCVSYLNSSNSKWQQEAQTFLLWRDLILVAAYTYQTNVENDGILNHPSFDEFLLTAPALIWP